MHTENREGYSGASASSDELLKTGFDGMELQNVSLQNHFCCYYADIQPLLKLMKTLFFRMYQKTFIPFFWNLPTELPTKRLHNFWSRPVHGARHELFSGFYLNPCWLRGGMCLFLFGYFLPCFNKSGEEGFKIIGNPEEDEIGKRFHTEKGMFSAGKTSQLL